MNTYLLSFSSIFIRQVCYQTIPPNMKRTAGLLENQMAAVVSKHVLEGLYSLHFFFFIKDCVGCGMVLRHKTLAKKSKKNPRGMWVGERDYLRIQKESKIIHVSESRRPSCKKRETFQLQRKKVTTIKKKCFQTAQS